MRNFSLSQIEERYDNVVVDVNAGVRLEEATKRQGLSRTRFSRIRCVAEAYKVDEAALRSAMLNLRTITCEAMIPPAKDICNRKLAELRILHADDKVLKPRDRY